MYDPLIKLLKGATGKRVGIVGLGGLGVMGIKLAKALVRHSEFESGTRACGIRIPSGISVPDAQV